MPDNTARNDATGDRIALDEVLGEISKEAGRLAEQCGVIQWSISAMLDLVDHPDLGAEIHMLQDIDRIQQTLVDIASILAATRTRMPGQTVDRDGVLASVRLESLRQRLGLSPGPAAERPAEDPSEITWL